MRKWVSQMENKKRFSISLTTQILIATAGGIVFGALVGEWASNLKLNKIAARWPAKAVAQFFTFSKKGSDRIVPR